MSILSQEEIDRLLQGEANDEAATPPKESGAIAPPNKEISNGGKKKNGGGRLSDTLHKPHFFLRYEIVSPSGETDILNLSAESVALLKRRGFSVRRLNPKSLN